MGEFGADVGAGDLFFGLEVLSALAGEGVEALGGREEEGRERVEGWKESCEGVVDGHCSLFSFCAFRLSILWFVGLSSDGDGAV